MSISSFKPLDLASILLLALISWPTQAGDYEVREGVTYAQRDSGPLQADIYLPKAKGPNAGVVLIHGGGWIAGERNDMDDFAEALAERGYAVMNIDYRLAPEYRFPAQLEDSQAAVRWFRDKADELSLDPNRIGSYGYSAGAHLALLLGVRGDDANKVKAVVSGAGPTDLREYKDNKYVSKLMGPDADADLYDKASPITAVSQDDAPTFFYHGKRDWIVEYANSTRMLAALEQAGVPAKLETKPFGHIATFLFEGDTVNNAIDFLDIYLR